MKSFEKQVTSTTKKVKFKFVGFIQIIYVVFSNNNTKELLPKSFTIMFSGVMRLTVAEKISSFKYVSN